MSKSSTSASPTADREVVTSRLIDAPRELVFKAWTEPEHIGKWFGPNGFRITTEKMELKPGGQWLFVMHGPDGTDYINKITYRKIVQPEMLEYDQSGGGDHDWIKFHVIVTFEAQGRKTLLTLNSVFETAAMRNEVVEKFGAIEGARQTLGRLANHVATVGLDESMVFRTSRTFDAPRDLVFRAWTEPELLAEWFGPKGFKTEVLKMDLRPGGICHYCMTAPNGMKLWAKWVFREVSRPDRIVVVQSFSDEDANVGRHPMVPSWPAEKLSTVIFEENAGKTTVHLIGIPIEATAEELDAFKAGHDSMTTGWGSTFDELDVFLAKRLPAKTGDPEVHIERFIPAPAEMVYKAWTNAESLKNWYAPNGCSTPFVKVDVRVGGAYLFCIRTPQGYNCWCGGHYLEVVPNKRLVSTMYRTDEAGNMVEPASVGMDPEWPREMVLTLTFEPRDGGTLVTLHQTVSEVVAKRTGAHPSWLQMFDRLAEVVGPVPN